MLEFVKSLFRHEQPLVRFDEWEVALKGPGGTEQRLLWSDLRAVYIVTTDDGPWKEDLFWVLRGEDASLLVPSETAGTSALLERLQCLPGFDTEAALHAMTCTDNNRFHVWESSS